MARKQKAKGFNKFLDFIGLVDAAPEEEFDMEYDYNGGRGKKNANVRNDRLDDEFGDEPRMTRVSRRERPAAGTNQANGNRFSADEGWDVSASRPEYASERTNRTQHSPSAAAHRGNARYGENQRYGAGQVRVNGRYEQGESENAYRRGSFYTNGGTYGASSGYRANGTSAYMSAGGRRGNDMDGGMNFQQEPQRNQAGGWQRHQTVIFKLHSVDECKEVILALIEKKSVLLNLDDLDSLQAQRTLDTMSGATYAIGATLSRASDRTWLITPSNVEVADSQMDDSGRYGGRRLM